MWTATILEHELLESAVQYTQEVQEAINESTYWQLKRSWINGSVPPNQNDWYTLDLTFRSDMWSFFYNLSGSPFSHDGYPLTPLQHASFNLWRRFGFVIWSTARMSAYGLLPSDPWHAAGEEVPFFEARKSLLTQDEKDEIDKVIRRWEIEGR